MTEVAKQHLFAAFSDLVAHTLGVPTCTGRFTLSYDLKLGGLMNIERTECARVDLKEKNSGAKS